MEPITEPHPPYYAYETDTYYVHPELRNSLEEADSEARGPKVLEGEGILEGIEHDGYVLTARHGLVVEVEGEIASEDGNSVSPSEQAKDVEEVDTKQSQRPARGGPPRIPIPIQALMHKDPAVDKFSLTNPPLFKPMPQKRLINQFYTHYNRAQKQVRAPLPEHLIEHIKYMAFLYQDFPGETEFHRRLKQELNTRPVGRKRPWSRKLHAITSRFIRRRYQHFLKEYVPQIEKKEDGTWKVENAGLSEFDDSIYPLLLPEHKMGFTLSCGTKVGKVNDN